MAGSSGGGGGRNRRDRLAAQRAADQQAKVRNRRLLLAGGAIVVVIAVVLGIVFGLSGGNGSSSGSTAGNTAAAPTGSALTSVLGQLTSVPAGTLDQVGAGTTAANPTTITGPALTSAGKPEVLYIGAEYCPYCAAERWAMIVALNRFGTFSGLSPIRSAAKDGGGNAEPFPLTPTWTFAKSTYASSYLTFTPVEGYTNIPDKATGFYTVLQAPTAAQQALLNKYDAANQGAIPFIDYGNKFMSVGASYNPAVLSGLTWAQIADDLHDPTSTVGKSVLGTANFATAAICSLTNDQPASACTAAVRALQAKI
jgi:Domain of unknown function (DUF929)